MSGWEDEDESGCSDSNESSDCGGAPAACRANGSRCCNSSSGSNGRAAGSCSSSSSSVEERAWSRLQEERRSDGYRDGLAAATALDGGELLLQSSFNDGFARCFSFCLRLAKLRGLLEGAAADAAPAPPAAAGLTGPADGGCRGGDANLLSSAADRVASLEAAVVADTTRPADGTWRPEERYGRELAELTHLVDRLLHERGLADAAAVAPDRTAGDAGDGATAR